MLKNIKGIFDSITPDNIKDIPVIKESMEIFLEVLEEKSSESKDIRSAFQNELIKEELVKVYLDDLYSVLKAVQLNEQLLEAVDKNNNFYGENNGEVFKKDAIINISKYINEEHFLSFKSYKQTKGTTKAIEYIYLLISNIVGSKSEHGNFVISEGNNPFELNMEGGLPKEFYEYIIYPLAHPLGFIFNYVRLVELILEDYFPELNILYKTNVLETRCLFPDGTTKVKKFIDRTLSENEQAELSLDPDLEILEIKNYFEGTSRVRKIILNNNTFFVQTTTSLGQTNVKLYSGDDSNSTLINSFAGQCSIYMEYDQEVITSVQEETTTLIDANEASDYVARLDFNNVNSSLAADENVISSIKYNVDTGEFLGSLLIEQEPSFVDEADVGFVIGQENTTIGDTFELTEFFSGSFYNPFLSVDGDYNIGGDYSNGRIEIFYVPTWEADIKYLCGKYLENVEIKDENNNVVYIQPLKYVDTVENTPIVDQILSTRIYKNQNIGNDNTIAREYSYESIYTDPFGNDENTTILYEPVYSGTPNFIDYNGDSRGYIATYLFYIENVEGKTIGDKYTIGGFYDDNTIYNADLDTNLPIKVFETKVNGDAVSLQYYSSDPIDIYTENYFDEPYQDIVDEYPHQLQASFTYDGVSDSYDYTQIDEQKETVVAFTLNRQVTYTVYDDSFVWSQHIDDGTIIGDNSYISYKIGEETVYAEPFFKDDNINPDTDDILDIGVYRNGILLTDNNVAALNN